MKLVADTIGKLPKGYDAESNSNGGFVILEMFFGEVWESLQQMTNFSYWMVRGCLSLFCNICLYIQAVDGRWGSKEKDGTWNGMVGVRKKTYD